MKANELRIGNLVKLLDGTVFTISSIEQKGFTVQNKEETTWIEAEEFEPIPLTEEWLLKFGFEKIITDTEDAYGIDYNLEVPDICYISYSDDFSCAIYGSEYASKNSIGAVPNWNSIKYVHGLQNLYFALTGEELTIGGDNG
jgi:hypothetical protein